MSKTKEPKSAQSLSIIVNGEACDCPQGTSLADLLTILRITTGKVAVERNHVITPRSLYAETELQDGDEIEIVRFVGGG
ncbi:MAG: sulfur carrier protein ThiS [Parvularcula sp.]|jgi:thiamine biosynthesis protein ThiS|nr:sulfur carrier protein ThiS [Parvularcula sp.]